MMPSRPLELVLAQAGPQGGGLEAMLPLVLILVVFYFLLVRPQQKKANEHKQLVESLKKNDHVVTAGGLYGRIVDVAENSVTLEIAPNVIVRHERNQITGVTGGKESKNQRRTGS
jgi:preprotein translocase subunit YajC